MNRSEAAKLLTFSAALTGREPTEEAATAWAIVLDDITLADAMVAVRAHYRESRFPVTPADILDHVNRARVAAEREATRAAAIERKRAANAQHRRQVLAEGHGLRDSDVLWEGVGWTGDDQPGDSLRTSVPASSIASRSA